MKDQIIQKWFNTVTFESEKCFYYKEFDMTYQRRKYLSLLPPDLWLPLCRFRTANHKLPVEVYSWNVLHIPRQSRKCNICNLNDIGDEYHYIMTCTFFNEIRELYLPAYFKNRPSVFKFVNLMNTTKPKILFNLAKFIRVILEIFQ